jgi:FtsZ-binding cell division protein ZapB
MNNSIFNSNLSTSNPFSLGNNTSSTQDLENSLLQSYARLEALKSKQNQIPQYQQAIAPQQNTVFTEIYNEFDGLSKTEMDFIVNSQEYQALNARYQTEFSNFLIGKFSSEYLQTPNAKTLEEMLYTIRQKKEQYKQKFTDDINEIRAQNKALAENNNLLIQNNQQLQEQLKAIQTRLSEGV